VCNSSNVVSLGLMGLQLWLSTHVEGSMVFISLMTLQKRLVLQHNDRCIVAVSLLAIANPLVQRRGFWVGLQSVPKALTFLAGCYVNFDCLKVGMYQVDCDEHTCNARHAGSDALSMVDVRSNMINLTYTWKHQRRSVINKKHTTQCISTCLLITSVINKDQLARERNASSSTLDTD
jgi:hypothetical protein